MANQAYAQVELRLSSAGADAGVLGAALAAAHASTSSASGNQITACVVRSPRISSWCFLIGMVAGFVLGAIAVLLFRH
jgi:hypothetical protein